MSASTTRTTTSTPKRHNDDHWIDEVRIEGPRGPMLRLVTVERWKTSGLSGDEWRFSAQWQTRIGGEWVHAEGYRTHTVRDGALRLYALVSEHLDAHRDEPVTVHLYRKGVLLWNAPETRTLRDAAGHLSWDLAIGGEQHDAIPAERATAGMCMQPGCTSAPIVRLVIRDEYDHCGNKEDRIPGPYGVGHMQRHRDFCDRHAHRGDCALEDADSNYDRVPLPRA